MKLTERWCFFNVEIFQVPQRAGIRNSLYKKFRLQNIKSWLHGFEPQNSLYKQFRLQNNTLMVDYMILSPYYVKYFIDVLTEWPSAQLTVDI